MFKNLESVEQQLKAVEESEQKYMDAMGKFSGYLTDTKKTFNSETFEKLQRAEIGAETWYRSQLEILSNEVRKLVQEINRKEGKTCQV